MVQNKVARFYGPRCMCVCVHLCNTLPLV